MVYCSGAFQKTSISFHMGKLPCWREKPIKFKKWQHLAAFKHQNQVAFQKVRRKTNFSFLCSLLVQNLSVAIKKDMESTKVKNAENNREIK